ncbi:hypothetical protein Ae706Ps2_6404c [Pseudonocardia sp. Ae706_Ps2]|nr:hypothetical protein Ae706Ps2_6404c [Pseudonocardia sp. Ae706_Ps2]
MQPAPRQIRRDRGGVPAADLQRRRPLPLLGEAVHRLQLGHRRRVLHQMGEQPTRADRAQLLRVTGQDDLRPRTRSHPHDQVQISGGGHPRLVHDNQIPRPQPVADLTVGAGGEPATEHSSVDRVDVGVSEVVRRDLRRRHPQDTPPDLAGPHLRQRRHGARLPRSRRTDDHISRDPRGQHPQHRLHLIRRQTQLIKLGPHPRGLLRHQTDVQSRGHPRDHRLFPPEVRSRGVTLTMRPPQHVAAVPDHRRPISTHPGTPVPAQLIRHRRRLSHRHLHHIRTAHRLPSPPLQRRRTLHRRRSAEPQISPPVTDTSLDRQHQIPDVPHRIQRRHPLHRTRQQPVPGQPLTPPPTRSGFRDRRQRTTQLLRTLPSPPLQSHRTRIRRLRRARVEHRRLRDLPQHRHRRLPPRPRPILLRQHLSPRHDLPPPRRRRRQQRLINTGNLPRQPIRTVPPPHPGRSTHLLLQGLLVDRVHRLLDPGERRSIQSADLPPRGHGAVQQRRMRVQLRLISTTGRMRPQRPRRPRTLLESPHPRRRPRTRMTTRPRHRNPRIRKRHRRLHRRPMRRPDLLRVLHRTRCQQRRVIHAHRLRRTERPVVIRHRPATIRLRGPANLLHTLRARRPLLPRDRTLDALFRRQIIPRARSDEHRILHRRIRMSQLPEHRTHITRRRHLARRERQPETSHPRPEPVPGRLARGHRLLVVARRVDTLRRPGLMCSTPRPANEVLHRSRADRRHPQHKPHPTSPDQRSSDDA